MALQTKRNLYYRFLFYFQTLFDPHFPVTWFYLPLKMHILYA